MYRLLFVFCVLCTSCIRHEEIKPTINYATPPHLIESLPSPFEPLNSLERQTDWGKELFIATNFAKDEDLFRAVTAYKRARYLMGDEDPSRIAQVEYDLLLSYWLANKMGSVIETFEKGKLKVNANDFTAYKELLIILYDAYAKNKDPKKKETISSYMEKDAKPLLQKIKLYEQLSSADMNALQQSSEPQIQSLLETFKNNRKSPGKAELFNACLPGAGYFYVGQTQSALTSFLLNAVFIAASYESFQHGQPAAGIICAGFEVGWYVGGIRGAGLAAKQYNDTLYSHLAQDLLAKQKLFPILMFEYGF